MNIPLFNTSIQESRNFLKTLKLFKGIGHNISGKYSQEFIDKSKSNNYFEMYDCAIKNGDYKYMLIEESIFQFSYEDNNIRYAFIQNPKNHLTLEEYALDIYKDDLAADPTIDVDSIISMVTEEEYEQFLSEQDINSSINYVRYDATTQGYQPLRHSYSHLHIGFHPDMRIPLKLYLTPLSFVKFCIKNTYYGDWINAFNIINDFEDFLKNSKSICSTLDSSKWKPEEEYDLFIT